MQAEVKVGLDKAVLLGVLPKVQPDAPVHSCLHRMVMAKKRTGKVRRTVVDLKPQNRVCLQQTHTVEPPSCKPAVSLPRVGRRASMPRKATTPSPYTRKTRSKPPS